MPAVLDCLADWRGPELAQATDWIRPLNADYMAEIDAAQRHVEKHDISLAEMRKDDFPLPTFSRDLVEMRANLQTGRGIQLYRGFPIDKYSKAQLRQIYWGISLHLGTPLTQSKHGDVIGDVRAIGTGAHEFTGRAYTSNEELHFHCDPSDIVGLFCLRTAKDGGLTKVASLVAIHNEMARTVPDQLDALYHPYIYNWRGRQPKGAAPDYEQPVFGVEDGRFVSQYSPSYIAWGYKMRGVEMTPTQKAALDTVTRLANDPAFHLQKSFSPGDMQFLNNLTMVHARTEFADHEDSDRKRHLLRVWLSVPDSPRLPQAFAAFFRDVRAGAVRGGYPSEGPITFETTHVQ